LERDAKVIFCNTPYNFINQNNTLSFRAFSVNAGEVDVPLSINFVKNNSTRISERGKASLKINGGGGNVNDGGTILITDNRRNTGSVERTAGEKVEETFLFDETVGNRVGVSDPNGFVDLKPKILAVGQIDRITNVFTATSTILRSSRGAVKFEVENIGTKISSTWTFNLVLPTIPRHIYHSKNQQALLPGDRIEYVIGFDSIKDDASSPNIIIVNIDPTNSVREKDKTNNIVKTELKTF